MKKINLICLFILYSALGVSSSEEYDFETKKINIENTIRDQIELQLLSFLSKKDFSIIADVDIKLTEKEKNSEVETNKNQQLIAIEKAELKELPGFSGLPEEPQEKLDGQLLTKEKTNFYSYVELLKVKITLIIDEELEEQIKEMAKELISEKVKYSYGIKGQFVFKEASVSEKKTVNSQVITYIKSYSDLLLLFFMFIFIIIVLYLILSKVISTKHSQNLQNRKLEKEQQEEKAKQLSEEQEGMVTDLTKEVYIEKFLNFITKEPFISRASFKNLSMEQKSAVVSAIEAPLLKNSFLSIMQVDEQSLTEEKDEEKLYQNLNSVLGQIKENISLQKMLLKQRFGYLNYLEPKEILDMVGGNNPKELSIIAQYIPESKYYELTNLLSEEMKVEIIKSLSNKEQVISENDREQLDERLKIEFDKSGGKVLSNKATNEKTIENFLDYDPKISQVINTLKGDSQFKLDETLDKNLDKYTITFADSIQNDFENISKIMLNEENEIIAAAIYSMEEKVKDEILSKFGKMRKDILTDLLRTGEYTEEQVDSAQSKILKIYRKNI